MVTVHPEYIVDEDKHTKAILLPIVEWEQIVNELEELDDIRAYDKAMASPEESVPFDQAVREIQEEYNG